MLVKKSLKKMASKSDRDWLILLHQLPAKQESARVKIWRMLQRVGGLSVKNSVYALPNGEEPRRVFEELAKEIRAYDGEAILILGEFVSGINVDNLKAEYNKLLKVAYRELFNDLKGIKDSVAEASTADEFMRLEHLKGKALSQMVSLAKRNYFELDEESLSKALLKELEQEIARERNAVVKSRRKNLSDKPFGAVWVTRRDPHVDRLASAWLIKRFIDKKAKLEFVDMDTYVHKKGHFRFDVFEGEFSHEGDLCTFETLIKHFDLKEKGLERIAHIIHDLDIKDEKYSLPETEGVRIMLAGLIRSETDDYHRNDKASQIFDSLFVQFNHLPNKSARKTLRRSTK
jgi:hypothetical protein